MKKYYKDYIIAFFIIFFPAFIIFSYIAYQKSIENIYEAATNGNIKRFVYLIENNNGDITQYNLRISFNNAIRNAQLDIVKYILSNNLINDIDKTKSFDLALKSQDKNIIKSILDLGIEKGKISQGLFSVIKNYYSPKNRSKTSELIDLLMRYGADKNVKGLDGAIPLNKAISHDDFNAFNSFLKHSFDVNKKGENGKTPTHHIIRSRSDIKYLEIIIEKGADLTLKDDEGNNAIHQCYMNKYHCSKMIDVLVKFKQDIEVLNSQGQNILHLCSKYENPKAIDKLIELGFNINQQDYNGNTPLHLAAMWKKYDDSLSQDLEPDSLIKLLEYNPDTTIKNNQNKTALDISREIKEGLTTQLLTEFMDK